eukprot:14208389-Heterocapsa_arctica.AAC.1
MNFLPLDALRRGLRGRRGRDQLPAAVLPHKVRVLPAAADGLPPALRAARRHGGGMSMLDKIIKLHIPRHGPGGSAGLRAVL